jgi:hypothetical protein
MSYRQFLTHTLGNLDVFAERIIAKRESPKVFVDGHGKLTSQDDDENRVAPASQLLSLVCDSGSAFATRIAFVTGDAGHGKTVLLREMQYRQAQAFLNGESAFLLWHVDLQGRQLVRLSEALMGDLGDLRMTGLWMPAILKLIQSRSIVLAIDGFDELAAEQGSGDALGSLAALVQQLGGRGIIVAASRRTFFDTEDYLQRAGLVTRKMEAPCEFDQISLSPWTRTEVVQLFSKYNWLGNIESPDDLYESILSALGGDASHPMLTRPFLVNQLARALDLYDVEPEQFIRGMDDPLRGVAALVKAFVDREVEQKWIHRDTGQPYLTSQQHMELLGNVAEEMYRSQKDRLKLDVIITIANVLMDVWEIPHESKIQALAMVKMHVLLTIPPGGDATERAFDHTEFRDYFVAFAIRRLIEDAASGIDLRALAPMFRIAQISDSTARYVCGMIDFGSEKIVGLAQNLSALVKSDLTASYLPVNVGTLIPFVLNGRQDASQRVEFNAPAVFTSLAFEHSKLENVTITGSTFVNVSLVGVQWRNVILKECVLGELTVDEETHVIDSWLENCEIAGVRIIHGDGDQIREYAPSRMQGALEDVGFSFGRESTDFDHVDFVDDTIFVRMVRRVLRKFQRSTVVSDEAFRKYFRHDVTLVVGEVIPMLENYGILEERQWYGSGTQKIWGLRVPLEDILAAEESSLPSLLRDFWVDAKQQ